MTDHNHAIFETGYSADTYRPKDPYFRALYDARLHMLQELPARSRVLELGCGSGAFLLPLHQRGYAMTGIDYSRSILDELQREATTLGVSTETLDVRCADARDTGLPPESFDAVYSFATLYVVPEVERALAETARVLRPGGRAFLELGNARSLNALLASRQANGLTSFHQTPARMRHLLAQSGLTVERVRAFQLFPYWGGDTGREANLLNPRLLEALAELGDDGRTLDERLCAQPWLQPFAFRQLWCVRKVGEAAATRSAAPSPVAPPPERDELRERRRRAAELVAAGDDGAALEQLIACVREAPDDPRAALDIAGLFDGDDAQRLVRRWRRTLTRSGRWPAEGASRSAAPAQPPSSPRVTVVLPTFDAGDLLPEAVQSVLDQTFGDFELVVVDDGSRDDTWRYLAAIRDPRVQALRQSNQKLPTALNRGFALARGEYRTWISADNVCAPTMLARLVEALDARPDAQLAVSAFARTDRRMTVRGVVGGQDVSLAGFLPRNPGVAAFLYRAEAAQRIGGYDAALEGAEDWDYWLRLLQHGPAVRVDDVLYRYREHGRSMTSTIPTRVRAASERTAAGWRARWGGLPPLAALGGDPAVYYRLGTRLLEAGFAPAAAAVDALREALQHDPADGRALVQLSVALARAGAPREAAELGRAFAAAEDPGLQRLSAALQALADGQDIDPASLPLLPADLPAPAMA